MLIFADAGRGLDLFPTGNTFLASNPPPWKFASQWISASPLIDKNNQEMALSKNYAMKKYFGQII